LSSGGRNKKTEGGGRGRKHLTLGVLPDGSDCPHEKKWGKVSAKGGEDGKRAKKKYLSAPD